MHWEFHDVLRFWLDRGADGIRIDSAAVLVKDFGFLACPWEPGALRTGPRPSGAMSGFRWSCTSVGRQTPIP